MVHISKRVKNCDIGTTDCGLNRPKKEFEIGVVVGYGDGRKSAKNVENGKKKGGKRQDLVVLVFK